MSSPGGLVRTASGREVLSESRDERVDEGAPIVRLTQITSETRLDASDLQTTPLSAPPISQSQQTEPLHILSHKDGYLDAHGNEAAEDVTEVADEKAAGYASSDTEVERNASFQTINPGDVTVLHDLARRMSRRRSTVSAADNVDLERSDTLAGLQLGDDVLDPQSEKFDLHKWLRMTLSQIDAEGIKIARSGVTFKDVNVSGKGSALNIQGTVGSLFTSPLRIGGLFKRQPHKQILRNFHGLIKPGELLIVLGRPGSGCSTLLKTLTGEMHGLHLDKGSTVHYSGIDQPHMLKEFKGEVIYNQEVDKHFPHLTVGETLEHAAAMRTPSTRLAGASRQEFIKQMTQVVMTIYGLSHTYNTKVGDDFVRGVSGGERKRVSIAEMALAGTSVAAWDNSTRGLDAATALKFTQSLRQTATLIGNSHAVAIYQASQAIYDLFDKAVVLYEGREIFYGRADRAKAYFEDMGWHCPSRQTTGDFLTSVTNPVERVAKKGYEDRVPRTPDEFEAHWHKSAEFKELQREITAFEQENPTGNEQQLADLRAMKGQQQAKHSRPKSPYVISIPMQIRLNTKRAWQRKWNDRAGTLTPVIGNIIMALIVGSVFYGTPNATSGFQSLGAALFFAILLNALTAISEINSLYAQRPIVEKHKSYAFYHPWTEAMAGIVLDIPIKFVTAVFFNIILYFLVGLRREPAQFFLFFLIAYVATFVMSAVFRTVAAVTKTVSQAMAVSGVLVLAIVVYTGFVVPTTYMKVWFSWIRWINPIYYAFEILIANEFHGREVTCSSFIPGYPGVFGGEYGDSFICSSVGSVAGQRTVNGDAYIAAAYNYHYSHVWRNFGILLGFLIAFMIMYFVAVELNSSTSSTAEVLVFRRGHVPKAMQSVDKASANDEEVGAADRTPASNEAGAEDAADIIPPQTDIFTWRGVNYDIQIKGETRRLLDNVSGWVKPGTLTALMGTSGAGKTTLLDVLAQRTTTGVITGNMFVNGAPLDASFQRKTGYVQQQDLHLETSTVREALRFSAMLRQPKDVSKQEKLDYVEDVIKMLNMEDFAEAVVGVPGQGLNVEQRKLLTIGVELAAKPKLLLFLDEPTSGLDSQSSWAICAFLRKLADAGQAVLCTIHQPSAILFQQYDRLLFLRKGGKTVYFGDIGENSRTLLDYFESNGARHCDEQENPAEYMLEICAEEKWVNIWNDSKEFQGVQNEIDRIHQDRQGKGEEDDSAQVHSEFAMPFSAQLKEVTIRVFQQYWRMPAYIASKMLLATLAGLFIGFSFYSANSTQQGMQNVLYALFMVTTIFSTLVQQIMPLFVTQRSLYEVRERPSKAYSWQAFLIANVIVEIPYQIMAGILVWATFYYPVVGIQSSERQGLVLLFMIVFLIFASTFAHMCIAALPDAETAGSIVTLLFSMTLIFNGVMQSPAALPGFWIFMYRVSPLTYWVAGLSATMLHGRQIQCSQTELSVFDPPAGLTCGTYLQQYLTVAPGTLQNPDATSACGYCSLRNADQFLAGVGINWSDRWRNFGLMWAYVVFNVFIAVLTYWLFRVRSANKKSKTKAKSGPKNAAPVEPGVPAQHSPLSASDSDEDVKYTQSSRQSFSSSNQPSAPTLTRFASDTGGGYLTQNLARVRTNPRNAHVY